MRPNVQPEKLSQLIELTGKMKQAMFDNNTLRPELMRIFDSMELRPTGYKLKAGDGINLLIFRNQESAIAWDVMSSYNISIADYTALFFAQWGYESKMIHFPEVVETTYPINQTFPEFYAQKYKLNGFEIGSDWCPLCRGAGFMALLKFDVDSVVDGIPSPLVKDVCIHKKIKFNREVLK